MEVIAEHLGAVQFEVKGRSHTIICDQPEHSGGFDEGMTPPEFLLASLATCAAYYAVQYLTASKLESQGLRVRVSAEKAKNPPRLASFKITVQTGAVLDQSQRSGVQEAVHKCLIHNTLLNPPQIDLEIATGGGRPVG